LKLPARSDVRRRARQKYSGTESAIHLIEINFAETNLRRLPSGVANQAICQENVSDLKAIFHRQRK